MTTQLQDLPLPSLRRELGGCPPIAVEPFGEVGGDAEPLLRTHGSDGAATPSTARPASLDARPASLDIEEGGGSGSEGTWHDDQQPAPGLGNEVQALIRALQRPSVALLVAALLLCIAVCVGCWVMNLAGWIMVVSSLSCAQQRELRNWLLAYLIGVLVEVGLLGAVRVLYTRLVQDFDLHVGTGCVRAFNVSFALLSSALKIFWCIHAQVLVAASKEGDCGSAVPRFVSAFSVVVLLRLLAVDTFLSLLAGLVLRFVEAGTSPGSADDVQAGGPAKPGTLEAMKTIEFRPSQSADGAEDGSAHAKECCFCLEEYDQEEAIVMTPCGHTMHRDCLKKWLRKSHLCPICRGDLEEPHSSK